MKERITRITGLMHQIMWEMKGCDSIRIDSNGLLEVTFLNEQDFIDAAKSFNAQVMCERREQIPLYKNKWAFVYNGVNFYVITNKEYKDAEITATEESVQS